MYKAGSRTFSTLKGATNYANKMFKITGVVLGITKVETALEKIMPMPAFPSIRK
jgi:hypothetical protein